MAKKDDGYVRFRCKQCGQQLKIRSTREGGDVIQCPKCGASVNVPLVNLAEIAKSADMAETGEPGRINVDPELLMRRLRGEDGKVQGPGSVGGPPTLREGRWSASAAFGRLTELDQLVASVSKIDQDMMGQVQRLYRERDTAPDEREQQFRVIADRRRSEIRELLANRLFAMQQEIRTLDAQRERLGRSEQDHLMSLKRVHEVLKLYGEHVYGVDV